MEQVLKLVRYGKVAIPVAILVAIGIGYAYVTGLSVEAQDDLLFSVQEFLPLFMFSTLAILLFTGFPVAFILGGLAMLYGMIGYMLDVFSLSPFFFLVNIL